MCFNTSSSFADASVLIPIGVSTLHAAWQGDRRYLILAAFPLLFGVQQVAEGLLWMDLTAGTVGRGAALGFLFFAYLLWPGLVPLAAWRIEDRPLRRRLFAVAAVLGGLLGASLFVPLVLRPDWLQVTVVKGSILYNPRLIYEPYISREAIRGIYAVIVALPLLGSSNAGVRRFGGLILASVVVSALVFGYAFVSIWCFFAALLSAYLAVRLPAQISTDATPLYGTGHWGAQGHRGA